MEILNAPSNETENLAMNAAQLKVALESKKNCQDKEIKLYCARDC